MQFYRLDNETDDQLIYRICSQKELIGSWDDVAKVLNEVLGNNYSESAYRKKYQSFSKMLESNEHLFCDYDTQVESLKQQIEDLRKEKIKVQTLNLERNRIDRNDARHELFYENIGKYIQSKEHPNFYVNDEYIDRQIEYILGIADVHMGALWDTPTNEYSDKIVKDRFEILLEETERFVFDHNLDKLTVVLLGDLIDGVLRISNLQMQDSKVSKAVADVSEIIGEFIDRLSTDCEIHIDVYDAVYGNHSTQRYLGTTKNYDMLGDLGYTIGRYIKSYLRNNENVNFYMPKENEMYIEFELNGFNFIAFHGHTIKSLDNAIKDLSMRNRKFYDYSLSGHIHSGAEITEGVSEMHNVQDIRFPSICGSDPYADSIFRQSKAGAMICGFEKDNGYVQSERIILN